MEWNKKLDRPSQTLAFSNTCIWSPPTQIQSFQAVLESVLPEATSSGYLGLCSTQSQPQSSPESRRGRGTGEERSSVSAVSEGMPLLHLPRGSRRVRLTLCENLVLQRGKKSYFSQETDTVIYISSGRKLAGE